MDKLKSFSSPAALILIMAATFALMLNSSLKESAVMDELAHIPAGYGYVKYFDYRLNPEHPPLVKALAALPLLFQPLSFPTDSQYWKNDVNGQWAVGTQFLYEYGNDADKIINWARIFPMILTLVLILFVYVWAKEILGKWWAFLPTLLVAFSPTFLAQGHYVTTDVGATLGIFTSIYYFSKFINEKSGKHLVFAGIAFGLAQLMKFSTVLLIPLFGFLILIYAISKSRNYDIGFGKKLLGFLREFFKYLGYLIVIFAIGYLIVYLVYFIFTINYPVAKQVTDTRFTLTSFGGGPDQNFASCKVKTNGTSFNALRCLADANIWMAGNKILRPLGEYMLGMLMVLQRASGGNTSYFLGEVSASGWWYYFPVVFLLKEPIPSLLLIALALFIAGFKFLRNPDSASIKSRFFNYLELNFAEFSMLSFVILYWAYSIKSPLNIGVRHILPTIPFIYILSSETIKNWIRHKITLSNNFIKNTLNATSNIIKISVKSALVIILVVWFIMESLVNMPYFISYFNELGGGVANGYKYVTDSNYDWGQDLKRLKTFVDSPPAGVKIGKIAVDYFGGGNPKYYLGNKVEYWQSSKGNPKYENIDWIAISINTLQSATEKLHPGQNRNSEDEYQWLQKVKNIYNPDYRAGNSIFVYKLN